MTTHPRVYLDNAATSWPKPAAVYEVVEDYQQRLGAAAGRGGSAEAEELGQAIEAARAAVARLISAEDPRHVVFAFNGTDALNLAIHGTLKPGDHVVTTVAEHNSVLRPLRWLEKQGRISVTRIGCDRFGLVDPDDIRNALRADTKLVIVTHASNVTGAIQPVEQIGRITRAAGVLFLVDAAQTIGHVPISVVDFNADLLAAPGHKGLLGPLGTGLLYIRPGVETEVDSVRQGGTGSASSSDEQPDTLPEKYESGNPNGPALAGLGAGLQFIEQQGLDTLRRRATELTERLQRGLLQIPGVTLHGPTDPAARVGVVNISVGELDAPAVAKVLEESYRVQVRAGFHCAALMHRALDTARRRGSIRFSVGPFTTVEEIDSAIHAIAAIAVAPLPSQAAAAAVECPCTDVEADPSNERSQLVPAEHQSGPPSLDVARDDLTTHNQLADLPGLAELWQETLGDERIPIAVLDGPIDRTHEAFRGARLTHLSDDGEPPTRDGRALRHGTFVAGLLFAQHDGASLRGIAPHCSGLLRTVFRDGPDGNIRPSSQGELAAAIDDAVQAGAKVINISGGEPSPGGDSDPELRAAIARCEQLGVLVVAAAGNGDCVGLSACDCLHVPAALTSVLAVGAMDHSGSPLEFSNCGSGYAGHGLLAPGAEIRGAAPGNSVALATGTSYAAPVVAGVAALLMSVQLKYGVEPNGSAIREALLKSADPCSPDEPDCRRVLTGRLNISKALSLVKEGVLQMQTDNELTPSGCGCQAKVAPPPVPEDDEKTRQLRERAASGSRGAVVSSAVADRELPVSRVVPSSCSAESNGDLVYVIGKIGFDFGTTGNRQSLQQNIPTPPGVDFDNPLQITDAFGLLAYLLGYKMRRRAASGNGSLEADSDDEGIEVCGNLHDAAYINWVLMQNNCPKYIVKPQGSYAEAGYLELIRFLIEQHGFLPYLHMADCCGDHAPSATSGDSTQADNPTDGKKYGNAEWDVLPPPCSSWYPYTGDVEFQLRGDCLKSYYCCHGGENCCPCIIDRFPVPSASQLGGTSDADDRADFALSAAQVASDFGLQVSAAEFISIAGELCGTKRLLTGKTLRVISPAMRSCSSWNTALLFALLADQLPSRDEKMFLLGMIQTLAEGAMNDGLLPEERAINFAATSVLEQLTTLLNPKISSFYNIVSDIVDIGGTATRVLHIGFDGVVVTPAKCRDVDTLPYEVSLIFYNTESLKPSRVFVTQTVNVADVNPVADVSRVSIRR